MAVKTMSEILDSIKARIGDDTSDEAIGFIEDITDTMNDMETRANESTDWKSKYEENDREWRQKYTERFFSEEVNIDDKIHSPNKPPEETKKITFESLFEEV